MQKLSILLIVSFIAMACEGVLFEEDLSDSNVTALAPSNNSILTETNVTFTWSTIEDADEYQIQIATPGFANANQILTDSMLNATTFNKVLESDQYEWRIRALNNSSETPYTTNSFTVESEVFEQDISNEIVTLIAPSEGAIVTTQTVNFSWEEVLFAEDYTIQIATPDFDNPVQLLVDEVVTDNSFTQDLDENSYQWRVKAQNTDSQTAYSTVSFSVTSDVIFQDQIVIINSPNDNFISNQSDIMLSWQEVEGATLYRIQVLDPMDNSIVSEQTTTNSSIVVSFPEGESNWQVRAENNSENTQYSMQSLTVDATAPNSPMLLTPMDLEMLTSATVTFTWTREPIEGTSEQDQLFIYSDVGLTDLVLNENVGGGTFTADLTAGETYYWLMNAFDEAGNQSPDSSIFSFTIQ